MNGENAVTASGSQGFRDTVIDSLRGFAIILFVIGHVIAGFGRGGLHLTGGSVVHDYIYSFHMPLFFIISGYVHGVRERFTSGQSCWSYVRKYAIDLYLPCLYFSFMYLIPKYILSSSSIGSAEGLEPATMESFLGIPFSGYGAYWFLCKLFFIKVIHIILERYVKSGVWHFTFWLSMYIIAIVLFFLKGMEYYEAVLFQSVLFRGLPFHIGFMMKRHNFIPQKLSSGVALFLAGMTCFCVSHFYDHGNVFIFAQTGAAICTSLGLFVVFYALNINNNFLVTCGVSSMVIYCIHDWILSSSRLVYRFTGLSSSANVFVLFILSSMCGLFIPLLVVWLYKNVKYLHWIEYIFYPGKFKK